jgi:hypothetical protein
MASRVGVGLGSDTDRAPKELKALRAAGVSVGVGLAPPPPLASRVGVGLSGAIARALNALNAAAGAGTSMVDMSESEVPLADEMLAVTWQLAPSALGARTRTSLNAAPSSARLPEKIGLDVITLQPLPVDRVTVVL